MGEDWTWLIDPCSILILATASFTILYGSYRGIHLPEYFKAPMNQIDSSHIKARTAIIMPIVGSITLILLFYFLNWLYYLLLAMMSFSSFFSLIYAIYPGIDILVNRYGTNKTYLFRWIGEMNTTSIICSGISFVVTLTWIIWPFWILTDILAVSIAISVLTFLRIPNLMIATILLSVFFFYDIFWVFLSEYIFKKNVMVTVATGLPTLPMVIIIPRVFTDGFSLLGTGDIVLPGIFLAYLYRFDIANGYTFRKGYFLRSWISYAVGLVVTLIMVFVLERGQPALLYLVPATLGTCYYYGWKRGEIKKLWEGIKLRNEDLPMTTADVDVDDNSMGTNMSSMSSNPDDSVSQRLLSNTE